MNAGNIVFNFKIDETALDKSLKNIGSKLQATGKVLTTFVSAPLIALAGFGVKYNMQMEQYQTGLEVLLGSAEDATNMLSDLKTMANTTPFETADLIDASQTLLAYGYNSKKILPTLKKLGDVSLGDKNKLKVLTLAFGQVASKGRLAGQELLQMVNAGFNPLQIISEKTGESMSSLEKKMSAGAISVDMVSEAFSIATTEGGRFYGGMDKQAQTATGKLSTMLDALKQAVGSLTESLLPIVTKVVEKVTELANKFNSLSDDQKESILKLIGVAIAIGPIISVIGTLIKTIGLAKSAFMLLGANPTLLAMAGIAVGVGVIITQILKLKGALEEAKAVAESFKTFETSITGKMNTQTGTMQTKGNAAQQKSYIDGLQKQLEAAIGMQNDAQDRYNNAKSSLGWLFTKDSFTQNLNTSKDYTNSIRENIKAMGATPKYAKGTNYVPNNGLAYLHKGEAVIPKRFNSGLSSNVIGSMKNSYKPRVNIINNITMNQDPLGRMVKDIKTYSGGAKNSYNYGGATS